jgi:hypothetical protein
MVEDIDPATNVHGGETLITVDESKKGKAQMRCC